MGCAAGQDEVLGGVDRLLEDGDEEHGAEVAEEGVGEDGAGEGPDGEEEVAGEAGAEDGVALEGEGGRRPEPVGHLLGVQHPGDQEYISNIH